MRLPALDLLRFFAALSVVFYHFTYRPNEAVFSWLQPITKYGYLGVDVFFIISGFVILMSATGKSVPSYLISRFSRLYPTFWVAIVVTTSVLILLRPAHVQSWQDVLLNFTMVPGYLGAGFVDGVYWTLAIELKFYFFVLLMLLFKGNAERWLWGWLILTAACYLPVPHALQSVVLFPYGAYFIAGAMFYLIWKDRPTVLRMAAIVICYLLCAFSTADRMGGFVTDGCAQIGALVIGGAFTVFLMLSLKLLPELKSKFWLSLGAFTYPLYLIHNEVGKAVALYYSPWVGLVLALVVVGGITWMMTRYAEKKASPAMRKWLSCIRFRADESTPY